MSGLDLVEQDVERYVPKTVPKTTPTAVRETFDSFRTTTRLSVGTSVSTFNELGFASFKYTAVTIRNEHASAKVYVDFDRTALTTTGMMIGPGEEKPIPCSPKNYISLVSDTATTPVHIVGWY